MYLPPSIYESLPYAYCTCGVALCIASYVGSPAAWSDTALGVGAGAIVLGLVLVLRRRSYRDDAARYDRHSLDD
jgi:hypothetical protein